MKRWPVYVMFGLTLLLAGSIQASHIHSTRAQQSLEELIGGSGRIEIISVQGRAAPPVSDAGRGRIYYDVGTNTFQASQNTGAYVTLVGAGGSAPANATYIVQTEHAGLSAKQALSSLSSGIMRVATGTGVITSLSDLLPLANGGTNANLTASNGGIFYSTATAGAILSGTATAGQMLRSGATAPPTWSTATFPAVATGTGTLIRADGTNWLASTLTIPDTVAISTLLYASSANVLAALATANSGVLVTSGAGVPSIATDIPTAVTIGTAYVYRAGGTDVALLDGGLNASLTASNGGIFYSTASAGAILAGTATANQVLLSGASAAPAWSTATYPASTTVSQLLYSSATNTVAGLATANSGVLITSGAGVPSISSTLPSATQDNITRLGTIAVPLVVSSVGPHAIGGATDANHQWRQLGTFTGSSATVGWAIASTLVGVVGGDIRSHLIDTTLQESSSGTHATLAGLDISTTITAGEAATTNFFGVRVQSTAVATGTTTATGLSVTSPTGATTNYAAQLSGTVSITAGTARIACTTVAALPAGVTGDRICVNDQLTTCPALDGTFTGGGAVTCSAFYNGTAWVHS